MQKAKTAWGKWAALVFSGVLMTSAAGQARRAKADGNGDILYSARYYLKPGTRNGSSHFHLYRINPDGSGKRQITFGAHDDNIAMWSPNGRQISFLRDNTMLLANADGTHITKLLGLGSTDTYWDGLRWSPDGKTIGYIHHATVGKLSSDVLYLINARTQKAERIVDVDHYAWSPDSKKLLLSGSAVGLRVLDWPSLQSRALQANVTTFAWISPNSWVGTIEVTGNDPTGIKELAVFDEQGAWLKSIAIPKNQDGDYVDWRSSVAPIPNALQTFLFVSDESTSSGYEALYFRVSAVDGHRTRLADGQFFAFAPDGKRYLNVTYRDTPPYDTLPNGHKRAVYTTKLQVGTSEKNLRDIVSGFVIIYSADWRASQ